MLQCTVVTLEGAWHCAVHSLTVQIMLVSPAAAGLVTRLRAGV